MFDGLWSDVHGSQTDFVGRAAGGGGAIAGQRHTPREPQHPSVNDDALSQL